MSVQFVNCMCWVSMDGITCEGMKVSFSVFCASHVCFYVKSLFLCVTFLCHICGVSLLSYCSLVFIYSKFSVRTVLGHSFSSPCVCPCPGELDSETVSWDVVGRSFARRASSSAGGWRQVLSDLVDWQQVHRGVWIPCQVRVFDGSQLLTRVAPNFGFGQAEIPPNFGFGQAEIRPFFPNSAKFGFGQISGRICQMPMQLQCVQLVT